jgi:hypothetical protein
MKQANQFERSLPQRLMAAFFVLVVAGFGFVQAVHVHDPVLEPSSAPSSHCSLCAVAHTTVAVTAASSTPVPTVHYEAQQLCEPQHESRLVISSSLIRPPPLSL